MRNLSCPGSRNQFAEPSPRLMAIEGCLGGSRGFVHKRIFGGLKGAIGGILGGPGGVVGGALGGFLQPTTIAQTLPLIRRPVGQQGCVPGFVRNAQGNCVPKGFSGAVFPPRGPTFVGAGQQPVIPQQARPGGVEGQLLPFGEAVMGRFGAGMKPAVFSQQQRRCPRGSVLGAPEADGTSLCYNRKEITNKERMWPRGRRPLLTGGEMRAISTAASAARKLQAKQKQLQELGLLKKPSPRQRAPKQLAPGHHEHVAHN